MNKCVLLELAKRWEQDAQTAEVLNGSPEAIESNAVQKGHRECKRECADTLRILVNMLGE